MSLLPSQIGPPVMLCVSLRKFVDSLFDQAARLLFDPLPFPKLRPKDEECCGGANQLVVGVLWHFGPGTMGYVASIGAFVAGSLGFAGSLEFGH